MSKVINSISDLEKGKEYNLYSIQFDANNTARFICGDTTELKRDIGYFQYSKRDYTPVNETRLRQMFKDDTLPHTVFALWGWELGQTYSITEIN